MGFSKGEQVGEAVMLGLNCIGLLASTDGISQLRKRASPDFIVHLREHVAALLRLVAGLKNGSITAPDERRFDGLEPELRRIDSLLQSSGLADEGALIESARTVLVQLGLRENEQHSPRQDRASTEKGGSMLQAVAAALMLEFPWIGKWHLAGPGTGPSEGAMLWMLTIDLVGSPYENAAVDRVLERFGQSGGTGSWLDCELREKAFHGAGDASQLDAIVGCFRAWVAAHHRARP